MSSARAARESDKHPVLFSPAFILLFVIEMFFQFGSAVTNPIVSNYAVSLGSTVAIGGLLTGLNAIASLASRPFSGLLTDKINKKYLLLISAALFTLSAFGCVLFKSAFLIGVCRVVQGVAFAIKSVLIISIATSIVPADSIGSGIGWIGIAYIFATIFGPVIGSGIGVRFGYYSSFIVSGCLFLVTFFLMPFIPSREKKFVVQSAEPTAREPRTRSVRGALSSLFYGPSVSFAVIAGLMMISTGATTGLILLIAEGRGIAHASTFFIAQAIVMVLSRPLAGKISDRFGLMAIFTPTTIFALLSMLLLINVKSLPVLLLSGCCMGLGQSSLHPVLQAESVRGVPKRVTGRASNTYYIGPDIGMGLGPIVGGLILQTCGPDAMFIFLSVVIVAASVVFVRHVRTRKLVWGQR